MSSLVGRVIPRRLGAAVTLAIAVAALGAQGVEAAYVDADGNCRHGSRLQLVPLESVCDPGVDPTTFEGSVTQHITRQYVDSAGHAVAELVICAFDMVGEHPTFGRMVIGLDLTRPCGPSTLRSVYAGQDTPYIHTTRLNITATAKSCPGGVLINANPIEFVSNPASVWPPVENVYTLPVAVQFVNRDQPGVVCMTACSGGRMLTGQAIPTPGGSSVGWAVLALVLLFISWRALEPAIVRRITDSATSGGDWTA